MDTILTKANRQIGKKIWVTKKTQQLQNKASEFGAKDPYADILIDLEEYENNKKKLAMLIVDENRWLSLTAWMKLNATW